MKVKLIQPITTFKGRLKASDVVEVKPRTAEKWIELGLARRVKR